MSDAVDAEAVETPTAPEPPQGSRGARRGSFRRLSDRTSLRTKLITAVLTLVILAIAAISVASIVMIRGYVTTRPDGDLQSALEHWEHTGQISPIINLGVAAPTLASNVVEGLQQSGSQLVWGSYNNLPGTGSNDPLPQLPAKGVWSGPTVGDISSVLSFPAQSGTHTWRVVAQTVAFTAGSQRSTAVLVFAEDIGDINALTVRLVLFDLIVGGAIVIVLAAVGAGVVRANLRALDDIELTAGQIAAGHLGHRVPEGDPRTEIGSLGRSLNAMLSQIERAFRAQEASERSAHESEERMRRFIADASHELRTPLTTIRGFAAHYRQRGGALGFLPSKSAAEIQDTSSRTSAPVPAFVNGTSGGGYGSSAGEPAETVIGGTVRTNEAGSNGVAANGFEEAGGSPGEDLDHLMARVESEAIRMGLLVEDLLTLARLDQQRPLAMGPVDLLTLAADAVQDARIVSPDRPIDLVVAPGTAFIVNGDESRLRQVLGNLVNNALTHTPAGTPIRVKIASGTVGPPPSTGGPVGDADIAAGADPFAEAGTSGEADASNGASGAGASNGAGGGGGAGGGAAAAATAGRAPVPAVVLDVEDDGPGMPADQAQRVFERFYRADAARNRASGGTGLGLAIVAGLVAAHGGTVAVRTAPGRGADFQVRLPLSPDVLAADPDDEWAR